MHAYNVRRILLRNVIHLRLHSLSHFLSTAFCNTVNMRSSTHLSVAIQLLGLTAARPSEVVVAPRAELQTSSNTYDYVIVGGGVTGLVVANRLTEDKKSKSNIKSQRKLGLYSYLTKQSLSLLLKLAVLMTILTFGCPMVRVMH
jgi:hypothetical protein